MHLYHIVLVIVSTYAICTTGFVLHRNTFTQRVGKNNNLYCEKDKHVLRRPVYAIPKINEYQILENRVKRLENILRDVCSAVIYCDDIAVMERRTAEHGVIYRGVRCSKYRNPVFMRWVIHNILLDHQMIATPLKYPWHTTYTNTKIPTKRK